MTDITAVNLGDHVAVVGGKYKGRTAVVVKCMSKMVGIRFLDSFEEVRVNRSSVSRMNEYKSVAVESMVLEKAVVDAATIRDAVDELRVIRARVDELIVLMEKVNFSK